MKGGPMDSLGRGQALVDIIEDLAEFCFGAETQMLISQCHQHSGCEGSGPYVGIAKQFKKQFVFIAILNGLLGRSRLTRSCIGDGFEAYHHLVQRGLQFIDSIGGQIEGD